MSNKLPVLLLSSVLCAMPLCGFADELAVEKAEEKASILESISFQPFTGRIFGNKVRMRTQPCLEGHVFKETKCGDLFAVIGLENDFYAVQPSKGTKGYVFRTYILDDVVEAERVNIRLAPDTEAPVIGRLRAGDKVTTTICEGNPKWFEIDLPSNCKFFIAKEYLENIGPVELLAKMEERHAEGLHRLNSAFLYGRSEIQKPFEEVDLDSIHQKFQKLMSDYSEFSDITEKAKEATSLIQETYIQKKIAFLESKADRTTAANDLATSHLLKLSQMERELLPTSSGSSDTESESSTNVGNISEAASATLGLATVASDVMIVTDKMLVWKPLEESLYQLWAATHGELTMDEFYKEEMQNATMLSGIVEPYNRPVKNRPGDFILRCDNQPVAFLYSTKINLQDVVGKKITVVGTPRPNNNFAFPAYFVLSIE